MADIATPIRNCVTEMNVQNTLRSLGMKRRPINIVKDDARAKENAHTKYVR